MSPDGVDLFYQKLGLSVTRGTTTPEGEQQCRRCGPRLISGSCGHWYEHLGSSECLVCLGANEYWAFLRISDGFFVHGYGDIQDGRTRVLNTPA